MSFVASIVFLAVLTFLGVGGELLAVVQLFRHGQRTPGSCYTNDPYKSISNWGGLSGGQLTNEGKRQHYQLGQFTRKRYSSFIPTKYNRSFIYAETTDVDRTHMSAQSNLYGLFPAKTTDQVWQKKVDWQAIPVHPADSDVWSSAFYKTSCAVYNTLLSEVLNSDEYEAIDSNYSAVYEYLSTYSGDNITTFSEANNIWDALKIEYLVGFSLPSWTKSVFPEPLRTLAGLVFELPTHTTQMKRITIGPFFNELVEYLEEMAEDNTSSQRFRIYSGHDTNIASVLNAFGAFSPPFPPEFASSIYIELHYESWRNVVRTYLKNGDNFTQLSVNGCNMDCTLENFRTVLSDYIVDVDTLEAECEETATATTVTNTDTRAVASPKRFSEEEVINLFKNWDS